jgi:hypothetical protein
MNVMKTERRYATMLPVCVFAAMFSIFHISCSSKDAPQSGGADPQAPEKPAADDYGLVAGARLPDDLAAAVSAVAVSGADSGAPRQVSLTTDGPPGGANAERGGLPKKIDEDLTALSGTVLFAKVYDMMTNPKGYMGKVVRIRGAYTPSFNNATGARYHYVMVSDVTACCMQGLEFIWRGKHAYPADYPAENTKIEVAGVFGRYEEDGSPYYYLDVDNITVKK